VTAPGRGERAAKPTVQSLGLDPQAQYWRSAGTGDGSVEVACAGTGSAAWVLLRVAGDPVGRILVYDRHEWECFLDGVRQHEFDDALGAQ